MPRKITSSDILDNKYEVRIDELSWRPSALAIVVKDGRLLLTKQRQTLHLPGGGVEFGETPEETVVRETREETGFIVANPRIANCLSGFFTFQTDQKNTHVQTIVLFYLCDLVGGEPSIRGFEDDEKPHGELPEWVELNNLDSITSDSTYDWLAVVRGLLASGRLEK